MADPTPENRSVNVTFERERGVYALEVTRDVAHAVIDVPEDERRIASIQEVLRVLAEGKVPVFLIKLHRAVVTLAFAGTYLAQAENTLNSAGWNANTRRDLALVVVRAASMRDLFGVMADIADSLNEAGARIYETSDSHNSVQCLIEAERIPAALSALCSTFHLNPGVVRENRILTEGAA